MPVKNVQDLEAKVKECGGRLLRMIITVLELRSVAWYGVSYEKFEQQFFQLILLDGIHRNSPSVVVR